MTGAAFLVAATLAVAGALDGPKIAVGRNVFVNPPGIIDAYSTPTIAENPRRPGNEIAVFRKDAPRLSAQLAWSTDRNTTWHMTALPLPPGDDRPFFPDAAFGPDGMLYVTYVNLTGTGNTPAHLFVAHSSDGGRTLSDPILIASGLTFQPRIAVGPDGVVHVVWLQVTRNGTTSLANASEQVVAAQSTDRGLTWSAPVGLSAPAGHLVGAASPAVAGPGLLVVAYEDFGPRPSSVGNGGTAPSGQPFDLLVTRSISGGTAFSAPTVVASAVRSAQRFSYFFPEFPGVAGGPHHNVYLVWSANLDVLLRRSTNDGATWQPPLRVHRAGDGSATLPAVSVAPAGRVDVVYLNEPGASPGLFTDVHLATSFDEGRPFETSDCHRSRSIPGLARHSAEGCPRIWGPIWAWPGTATPFIPPGGHSVGYGGHGTRGHRCRLCHGDWVGSQGALVVCRRRGCGRGGTRASCVDAPRPSPAGEGYRRGRTP